jgi:hypothetical protein
MVHTTVHTMVRGARGGVLAVAMLSAALCTAGASGQAQKVLTRLNEPWTRLLDENKSWKPILTAALDITEAPAPIGADFDVTGIWPGMEGWSDWAAWAEKNQAMGKALIANQEKLAFAMPYGEDKVDQAMRSKGFATTLDLETEGKKVRFGYFKALTAINAYVVADMYRLGEAGKFDEAFALGIAQIKLMRQVADQTMLEEKLFGLDAMSTGLSLHRDFAFTYMDKIPAATMQRVATKEYPLIRPQDGNQRLRRLEMPEGDRFVAEGILERCFDDRGQPSEALFAEVFAGLQSQDAPLTRFGAARRWAKIATLHGSLDASTKKLNEVYDDWWRRWRFRPYDPSTLVPTELSRLNGIRYAAVLLAVLDIEDAFKARLRVAADLNGTATAMALVACRRGTGAWPDDIEKAFPIYGLKKSNFDPYDTEFGELIFRNTGSERRVETQTGTVSIDGPMIFSRGSNNQDDGAQTSDPTADAYDVLYWPPLRAVARSSKG